jgi:hypothetical protein
MVKYDSAGAGRRVIGLGSSICAFAVRKYTSSAKTAGCSLGPLTDYVTVKFDPDQIDLPTGLAKKKINLDQIKKGRRLATTLSHELCHACNLSHKEFYAGDDNDKDNLMHPGGDNDGPSGTSLSKLQIAMIRSSRHVIY